MRVINFAKRSFKEIIRDPLSIIFAVILPLFLLFIFQQFKIPGENYKIQNFTPGIIVFGFSFITMFTATLVSKDRTTSLLIRLGISPMKSIDYILGYMLAIIPMILLQNILFFILALVLGLSFSVNIIWTVLAAVVVSILFISLGIIFGSLFTEKAASGISSIIVQLVCFTSQMYFPKELIGDVFAKICEYLPFESCVFCIYTIATLIIAIILFKKKMTK